MSTYTSAAVEGGTYAVVTHDRVLWPHYATRAEADAVAAKLSAAVSEPVSPVLDALGVWVGNVPVPAAQRPPESTTDDADKREV